MAAAATAIDQYGTVSTEQQHHSPQSAPSDESPPDQIFAKYPGGGATGDPPSFGVAMKSLLSLQQIPAGRDDLQSEERWMKDAARKPQLIADLIADVGQWIDDPGVRLRRLEPYYAEHKPYAPLTHDEECAIAAYTKSKPKIYAILNSWLMTDRHEELIIEKIAPYFLLLYRAMEKLERCVVPANRGVLVRNVTALVDTYNNYEERCQTGHSLNFWGFASFSRESKVTNKFCGASGTPGIIYSVGKLECVDIEAFSLMAVPEKEVLPLPPLQLKVQSKHMGRDGKLVIACEQLRSTAYCVQRWPKQDATKQQSGFPEWMRRLPTEITDDTKSLLVKQAISESIFKQLSEADLKELGVSSFGQRRLLAREIAEQQRTSSPTAPPPPAAQPRPSWCYPAYCASCGKSYSSPPPQWVCPNCNNKCWQPNSAAAACKICSTSFGVFTHRHHCRRDGWVVCDACSTATRELPRLGFTGPQRVCSRCTEPQKGELVAAVKQGDAAKVRELLEEREADANDTGEHCVKGEIKDDGELIAGVPALYAAVFAGNFEITKLLLEHGADPNVAEPSEGRTPLICAAANNNIDIARLLLEHKAEVNKTMKDGSSALYMAAACSNNVELVRLLLSAGAVVEQAGRDRRTPLLAAAAAGAGEVVAELLHAGAQKAAVTSTGAGAVSLGAEFGHAAVVKQLLDAGCDAEKARKDGWRPLHKALYEGHTDCVAELLRAGVDKAAALPNGCSAVYVAAAKGHVAVLKQLMDAGCDAEKANNNGWRALHIACFNGHADCVAQLLRAGADKAAQTNVGSTPLDIAKQNGHQNVVTLLQ